MKTTLRCLTALCVLSLTTACEAPKVEADAAKVVPATKVRAVTVEPTPFVERIELTATLEAPRDAKVAAQTGGQIKTLLALGAPVEAGQVIGLIDADALNAAVTQADGQIAAARAAVKLASDTHGRQRPLLDAKVISPLEFSAIEAQLQQAKATLKQANAMRRQARKMADNARIEAPFAGIIEQRFVEQGETVAPGQPVVRVVDTGRIKVVAGVPERYATDIKMGAEVEVGFNAYDLKPRKAKVTFVGQTIDRKSRSFPVEIELDNADRALKPEMIAKVKLNRARVNDSIAVPQTAVLYDEQGPSAFVAVQKDGKTIAALRRIKVGATSDGTVRILEGLEVGDAVIYFGNSLLTQGEQVELVSKAQEGGAK